MALAVYVLSGHSSQVAAEYCSFHRGVNGNEHNWHTTVEEWYLQRSMDKLIGITCPEKPSDLRIAQIAKKRLAERKTAHWVRDENFGPGVAPSSDAMIEKFVELAGPQVAKTVPLVSRTGRRFCQQLRQTWGIRFGVLKIRDDMPVSTIKAKAPESNWV